MANITPRTFDMRMLASHEEASHWLPAAHARHGGQPIDPLRLARVLADMHAWLAKEEAEEQHETA